MNDPNVFIVVLNWNNYKDTKECLQSLARLSYPNYKIIVSDNGSEDGSTKKLEQEFPENIYIYNNENLGFTGGTNIGMRRAYELGADFVFFINNDMIADRDFLQPLAAVLQDKKVGIAGPLTYCYPEKDKIYTSGRKLNFWKGSTREACVVKGIEEVQSLGGCFMIKREILEKVGYFYEPFFLIFEETDYCERVKKAGYKIVCQPKAVIWHKVRQSLDKMPMASNYYYYRNKLLFIKRNAPFYIKYFFYFYFSFFLFLKFLKNLALRKKDLAFTFQAALFDFWGGRFGKREIGK